MYYSIVQYYTKSLRFTWKRYIFISTLIGVDSQTVTLTPGTPTVTEGSPVTLTCTYTGPDTVLYCSWYSNETLLARLSSSCTVGIGVDVDTTLYSYTCTGGNVFTWTINNVTFEERAYGWDCRMVHSSILNVSNKLKINVEGKLSFLLEYKTTPV